MTAIAVGFGSWAEALAYANMAAATYGTRYRVYRSRRFLTWSIVSTDVL